MVFVHVQHRRNEIVPTREEVALIRDLEARGVRAEDLEAALAGRGVTPERARELASLMRPRTAAERARSAATTLLWVGIAIAFGMFGRPLRAWVRENWPGSEWLVDLLFPLVVMVAFVITLLSRIRRTRQAREAGVAHADQIDNKPIG